MFLTNVYAATPIPALDAVRSYFDTHESGFAQRILTVYKDEVAELYTRLHERLPTVVQRFWYVVFDEIWLLNSDIPVRGLWVQVDSWPPLMLWELQEVDRNFDIMDVLEDTAIAWKVRNRRMAAAVAASDSFVPQPMRKGALVELFLKRGLIDQARPWRLLGQYIEPLYHVMETEFNWRDGQMSVGSSSSDSGSGTDSGSSKASPNTPGTRGTRGTQRSSFTNGSGRASSDADRPSRRRRGSSEQSTDSTLSSLGSRTSAGSLMSERRRERRRRTKRRLRRRRSGHRRRHGGMQRRSSGSSGSDSSSSSGESSPQHAPAPRAERPDISDIQAGDASAGMSSRFREKWTDLARPRMARVANKAVHVSKATRGAHERKASPTRAKSIGSRSRVASVRRASRRKVSPARQSSRRLSKPSSMRKGSGGSIGPASATGVSRGSGGSVRGTRMLKKRSTKSKKLRTAATATP